MFPNLATPHQNLDILKEQTLKKRARAEAKRKALEEKELNDRLQTNQTDSQMATADFNQFVSKAQQQVAQDEKAAQAQEVLKVFKKSDLTQVFSLNDHPNIDKMMMTSEEKKAYDLAEKRKRKEEERAAKKKKKQQQES